MTAHPQAANLGCPNLGGAGALVAALHFKAHALVGGQCVEVQRTVDAAAMEEVFLSIFCGNEAEAAIGNDLLDGTSHSGLSNSFSNAITDAARPFEKE
jgi:hypothetical protein